MTDPLKLAAQLRAIKKNMPVAWRPLERKEAEQIASTLEHLAAENKALVNRAIVLTEENERLREDVEFLGNVREGQKGMIVKLADERDRLRANWEELRDRLRISETVCSDCPARLMVREIESREPAKTEGTHEGK